MLPCPAPLFLLAVYRYGGVLVPLDYSRSGTVMNTTLTRYVSIRDRTIAEIRSDGCVYVRSAQNRPVSHFDTLTRATKIGRVDVAAKSVQLPSGEQVGYLEGNN